MASYNSDFNGSDGTDFVSFGSGNPYDPAGQRVNILSPLGKAYSLLQKMAGNTQLLQEAGVPLSRIQNDLKNLTQSIDNVKNSEPADTLPFSYDLVIASSTLTEIISLLKQETVIKAFSALDNDITLLLPQLETAHEQLYRLGASLAGVIDAPDNEDTTSSTTVETPCFLKGTLIETSDGYRCIEDIQPGDKVKTFHMDEDFQEVVWVGNKHVRVHDKDIYPIRIKKNALADGLPFMDLFITPEHCLFHENALLPARLLVNGSSIQLDMTKKNYEVFHLQTIKHAIIKANGLYVETFLDTGHKHIFDSDKTLLSNGVITLENYRKTAPLYPVFPIEKCAKRIKEYYFYLKNRAEKTLGLPNVMTNPQLVPDADLRLVLDHNREIYPVKCKKGVYYFLLSPFNRSIIISSRYARPVDVVGPYVDDRRYLGVLVGKIFLYDRFKEYNITSHLCENALTGWHDREEAVEARWTNGAGVLPLEHHLVRSSCLLAVEILSAGPYLADEGLEPLALPSLLA